MGNSPCCVPGHTSILQKSFRASRLTTWKGWLLSRGGRLILVNSVLSTLTFYFMAVYGFPEWVINRFDRMRRAFLWKGMDGINGFHCPVSWGSVRKTKEQGGLGVKNLVKVNPLLLAKWPSKFLEGPMNLWWFQVKRVYHSRRHLSIRLMKGNKGILLVWRGVCMNSQAFGILIHLGWEMVLRYDFRRTSRYKRCHHAKNMRSCINKL